MKALLCKEFGPPETLSYEDVDDPVISPGKVIVDIYSASVNFPDVLIIEDKYFSLSQHFHFHLVARPQV